MECLTLQNIYSRQNASFSPSGFDDSEDKFAAVIPGSWSTKTDKNRLDWVLQKISKRLHVLNGCNFVARIQK